MRNTNPKHTRDIDLHSDPTVLNNLPYFRSAAHHLSFTRAAVELNLTQSAISHRIKKLERQLGFALFIRHNRQLALTQRGQQLLNIADQTFNSLERSLSDLQGENISGQLSLSASPSLAQHWLGAAIAAFKLQYPQLCVYLHTHNAQSPLSNPQLDLAITYGGPDYPGLHSEKLREEQLQVLCNEAYMQKMQLEHSPERLIHCQFIHDALAQPHAGPLCEWNHWLERAGLSAISPRPDMCFDMSALALNAAEQGCGVAIGRWSLSRERLARGSLVSPFDKVVQADAAYYLVCHPERRQSPVVQCLIDFLWDYIRTPTFESTLY